MNENGKYGKFGTAEELLAAYNALEREFTKRCQQLSSLMTERSEREHGDERECAQAISGSPDADISQAAAADAPRNEPDKPDRIGSGAQAEEQIASCNGDRSCGGNAEQNERAQSVLDEIAANAPDYAEMLSAIPAVMDACVAKYKQKLIAPMMSSSVQGVAVLTPVKRPKTLADAKLIADRMLSGRDL